MFSMALEKQEKQKISNISHEDALQKMKKSSICVDIPFMDDDEEEEEIPEG